MSDPCPNCDLATSFDGSFCRDCGYDADLATADYAGEGTELPESMDEAGYAHFLQEEGLEPKPSARLRWIVGIALLFLLARVLLRLF